jgi:hypothetical protein
MKYLLSYFVAFFLGSITVYAQNFPSVDTETLDGEIVTIPDAFSGHFTLIGVGTSKKAEDELKTWQIPVYNKFIAKTGLMDDMYDVKVCFLPLFTGVAKAAKNKVVKKLQENNESVVYDHLYIYSGAREPFEAFGIDDKSTPYFFLLDKSGKVVWKAEGEFRQVYIDKIEEVLTQ